MRCFLSISISCVSASTCFSSDRSFWLRHAGKPMATATSTMRPYVIFAWCVMRLSTLLNRSLTFFSRLSNFMSTYSLVRFSDSLTVSLTISQILSRSVGVSSLCAGNAMIESSIVRLMMYFIFYLLLCELNHEY